MKKIRIPRKVAYLLIVVVSLIIGGIVGFIIVHNRNTEEPEPISHNEGFIYLKNYEHQDINEEIKENTVFTSYNEYKKYFDEDTLTEKDFKNNNYILIPISYNSCSESDIVPTKYKIEGNDIKVTVSYTASCGFCAPEYILYLLKVDKKITKANVSFEYIANNEPHCNQDIAYKPLIYLYPTETTLVNVTLGNPNNITTSYPAYKNGWQMTASPNGTLVYNNREYYGLYWEGKEHTSNIKEEGFIVSGSNVASFLEEKLSILGLTEKEADEFIIYWLPKLEKNKYNYIYFETMEEINNYMPLNITPTPDTLIRVFMDYKPLNEKIEIKNQELNSPIRTGFTVVEWGGSLIK